MVNYQSPVLIKNAIDRDVQKVDKCAFTSHKSVIFSLLAWNLTFEDSCCLPIGKVCLFVC